MRLLRQIAVVLVVVFAFVLPGTGCGPFFPEAVFVVRTRPDGAYADYVKGRIGVPQPGYRVRHLVVAYDWLNGHGLSAAEQQQAIAVDQMLSPSLYPTAPEAKTDAGRDAWVAARQASGVPGGPQAVPAKPDQPWTARTAVQSVETDRSVPGDEYQSFANCLDDAFVTAAATLTSRKAEHASDPAGVADWVHGQDAVFANCGNAPSTMPADVPANAPAWLRQDRVYQVAAAKFYAMDFDGAIALLRGIAADAGSPWRGTARLVMARAMIRRASVGQITEVPAEAVAPRNAPYSEKRAEILRTYNDQLTAKRPARLAEARDVLRAIVADPMMQRFHTSAEGLLDYLLLRLDPGAQGQALAGRLTASDRPQTPGVFRQALIDMTYLMYPPGAQAGPTAASETAPDVVRWMRTMAAADRGQLRESLFVTHDEVRDETERRAGAARAAMSGWQKKPTTPWLIAAMTAVEPGSSGVADLVRAASVVPRSSPAWVASTYYRLVLNRDASQVRAELDTLLPMLTREQSRSTVNLFTIVRQRGSLTLAAFLRDAGTLPAAVASEDDDPDPPATKPDPNGLCGVQTSEAETRLFDHDASTVLNTRMPLRLMAEAAGDQTLQKNLRFQIAQATWARAVLLGQPEVARRMSPVLIGCYPAWRPWLEKYDAAKDAEDRQVSGLLALMRFASTEPIVRDGEQRPEGFATYSNYRDNWWQESKAGGPPTNTDGTRSTSGTVLPTFFGTLPATREELPDPPFLTETERTEAEHEVATLRGIPCASDYFAQRALEWQRAHPADARTPDVLGFAERVVRNGCRTDATKELNHQLFTVVQTEYGKSEWADKYKTWE